MRKVFKRTLCLVLALCLFVPMSAFAASSGHPKGWWPYQVAYNEAIDSGNEDAILKAGEDLLNFYAKYEINTDIAANSFNVYYYRYVNSVYEKRGDYAAAQENLAKLRYVSEIAGISDMDVVTEAKARKIDTHMGVFALTESGEDALYYGAKNELRDGVYYGRVFSTENKKVSNTDKIKDESIVSLYVELGQETVSDYAWILEQVDFDEKALHVALNFPKEGTTVTEINQGMHDDNIRTTLRYLAKLDQPVFLRIGAEMNVWSTPTEPQAFRDAYIRIAKMARDLAPEVALIFSVNHVGSYGDDMSVYYPGDEYVDWVGVSLYYNRYQNSKTCEEGEDFNNMYFGVGNWAEPVTSVAEVVERFGDRKPIMITEGGVGHYNTATNMDLSDYAAERVTSAYRALTMVYPQIKGILYFDTNVNVSDYQYDLEQNPKVEAAFDAAVAANKTLLHSTADAAMRYVSLENFCEKTDSISISAYCNAHYSNAVHVDYYLDGALYQRGSGIVHDVTLYTASLSEGAHTFKAVFSDGANFTETLEYTLVKNAFGVVKFAAAGETAPSTAISAWAVPEVTAANELGLVPDSILCDLTSNITRADFCTLILRLLTERMDMTGEELLAKFGKTVNVNAFTDTKAEAVLIANALGILNGRGNGIFDPDSSITRQEAATMLYNAAKRMEIDGGEGGTFTDSGEFASWAAAGIAFVSSARDKTTQNAVMGGLGDGRFNPKGTYTKEQAILTMVRLFRA